MDSQSAVSIFHSSIRNTIITNGVALTLFGMSINNISKFWKNLLTLIAYIFVLISVFISYNASRHLKITLEHDIIKANNEEGEHSEAYKTLLREWNKWYLLGLSLSLIIFIIGTLILISKSIIPFNI